MNNKQGFNSEVFARKVLIAVGIIIPIILLLLLFGVAFNVVLLLMAAVLVAVFFRGIASFIHKKLKIGMKWSIPLSIVGVLAILTVAFILMAPSVSEQSQKLSDELPKAFEDLKEKAEGNPIFDRITKKSNVEKLSQGQGSWAQKAFGAFSTGLGILADIYVIFFLGLFFTFSPEPLIKGIVSLVPISKRDRANEVFDSLGKQLKKWLLAKLFSMAVVGIFSTIGLLLLDIPLAIVLGIIAGFLSFIPNFGPILALIPAVLIALSQGTNDALYVIILYVGIQALESNLITPFVEKNMVSIPIALVLIAQIMMGVFSGGLGLILATPIAVTVILLVKMLYVEDVLGDTSVKG